MAGVKGKSGRPKSDVEREGYFLRLRPEVIDRVQRCTPLLEIQEGVTMSKAEALEHLLTMACAAVERTREDRAAPAPTEIFRISEISDGIHAGYEDMPELLGEEEALEPSPGPLVPAPRFLESPSPDPAPAVAQTPTAATMAPRRQRGLPREKLQAIADERTRCEGLSLRDFAKRLHDRGLYSSIARDGSKVPANPGTLTALLKQAKEEGMY